MNSSTEAYGNVLGGKLKLKGMGLKTKKKKKKSKKRKLSDEEANLANGSESNGLDGEFVGTEEEQATHETAAVEDEEEDMQGLTKSQRSFLKRQKKKIVDEKVNKSYRQRIELQSYRQRIEELNSRLSTMTEHNDIPRVSAAGNG
mmetsp:Transcript_5068/g.6674  ORF Transcript_5068/g.6674 Transcript_5068/m.6674 type:complete len:145 (-) Transcript_5068:277-711(-)